MAVELLSPAGNMEKLRAAVNSGTRLNLTAALKIIDSYRKGQR